MLIAVFTAPVAILFDALSYLASALLLLGARQPEPPPVAAPRAGSVTRAPRREIREGIVSLWRQPLLRALLGAMLGLSIGWALVEGTLMFYIVRMLALPSEAAGAVFSIGNVGLPIAATCASPSVRDGQPNSRARNRDAVGAQHAAPPRCATRSTVSRSGSGASTATYPPAPGISDSACAPRSSGNDCWRGTRHLPRITYCDQPRRPCSQATVIWCGEAV